jgi:ATPase family associated with various cellular activities (AAA)
MHPTSVLNIDDELSVFAWGAPALTPAQKNVAAELSSGLAVAQVNVLRVAPGMGRTTIMHFVHGQAGGAFIVARKFLNRLSKRSPNALEETFMGLLTEAVDGAQTVFIDDLHLFIEDVGHYDGQRAKLIKAVLTALLDEAARQGKKFVLAVNGQDEPVAVSRRAIVWEMADFEPEDYACLAEHYLGGAAARLDMAAVHRFAPGLTAHQIKNACLWLGLREADPDTASLIGYFRAYNGSRNVDAKVVQTVEWSHLRGVDHVIEELETEIALLFQNDQTLH